jgi:hypothetical protein
MKSRVPVLVIAALLAGLWRRPVDRGACRSARTDDAGADVQS